MSSGAFGAYDSVSRRRASGSSTRPIGTFSQKIHCQEMCSVSEPPISGPLATATPVTAPKIPRAAPRRSAGIAAPIRVSVSGIMTAAPTPWTARKAISSSMPGERAAAAEAAVKRASPDMNSRRLPNRSPSAAPSISSTAKVRVYALTVHSSSSRPPPRLSRMDGRAVVTTRLSRAAMNPATLVMTRTQTAPPRPALSCCAFTSPPADELSITNFYGQETGRARVAPFTRRAAARRRTRSRRGDRPGSPARRGC